jgi:hypothetical protein
MRKGDFPQIWVPDWENRDLRQLLWHRHRMVQARTRIMNQLQAVETKALLWLNTSHLRYGVRHENWFLPP